MNRWKYRQDVACEFGCFRKQVAELNVWIRLPYLEESRLFEYSKYLEAQEKSGSFW